MAPCLAAWRCLAAAALAAVAAAGGSVAPPTPAAAAGNATGAVYTAANVADYQVGTNMAPSRTRAARSVCAQHARVGDAQQRSAVCS